MILNDPEPIKLKRILEISDSDAGLKLKKYGKCEDAVVERTATGRQNFDIL